MKTWIGVIPSARLLVPVVAKYSENIQGRRLITNKGYHFAFDFRLRVLCELRIVSSYLHNIFRRIASGCVESKYEIRIFTTLILSITP